MFNEVLRGRVITSYHLRYSTCVFDSSIVNSVIDIHNAIFVFVVAISLLLIGNLAHIVPSSELTWSFVQFHYCLSVWKVHWVATVQQFFRRFSLESAARSMILNWVRLLSYSLVTSCVVMMLVLIKHGWRILARLHMTMAFAIGDVLHIIKLLVLILRSVMHFIHRNLLKSTVLVHFVQVFIPFKLRFWV